MQTPFIKASCGCVVIPLNKPSGIPNHTDCILLKACDGDAEWCFHVRALESWKIDTKHVNVKRPEEVARFLTDEETQKVIKAIGMLVGCGNSAHEMSRSLACIQRQLDQMPSL